LPQLLDQLEVSIGELDRAVAEQASARPAARCLMTQVPSNDSSTNLGRRKRFRVKEKTLPGKRAEKCVLTEPTSL
jgi:hypothetical protein